jgi:integrase
MSVYLVKGKGWRYDFIRNKNRYSEAGFKTKREARHAEAKRREEIENPVLVSENVTTPTDMVFLELVNRRLDYVQAYSSERYYTDHYYMARRWIKQWGRLNCNDVSADKIQSFVLKRARAVSAHTGNKELRSLRALFNFGIHPARGWIKHNPTYGIAFLPVEKKLKYVPPKEDVLRVILAADRDTQEYLWTIALTLARVSEINRLIWQDVDLKARSIVLYTRKKKGGHLTPRRIPMTERLHEILHHRYTHRDKRKPWVFWHRYWSKKDGGWIDKPYTDRKTFMKSLCKKEGVQYFRFHALRHFGASMLDHANVPIGSIQRILGHENRTTTEIYLHSIGDAEREAMDVLNRQFADDFQKKSHTKSHTKKNGFRG